MASLAGKTILVTRAREQFNETRQTIESMGGKAVSFPCLEVQPLIQNIQQHRHLFSAPTTSRNPGDVIFTSMNGVAAVAQALADEPSGLAALGDHHRIVAVGSKTAALLESHSLTADIVPEVQSQKGLIAAYQTHGWPERAVFFRASEGRGELMKALQAHGTETHLLHAYKTICPNDPATKIIQQMQRAAIHAVLLASPKTARHYLQRIGDSRVANSIVIAAISPNVEKSAMDIGLDVQVTAKKASLEAMLTSLAEYFEKKDKHVYV